LRRGPWRSGRGTRKPRGSTREIAERIEDELATLSSRDPKATLGQPTRPDASRQEATESLASVRTDRRQGPGDWVRPPPGSPSRRRRAPTAASRLAIKDRIVRAAPKPRFASRPSSVASGSTCTSSEGATSCPPRMRPRRESPSMPRRAVEAYALAARLVRERCFRTTRPTPKRCEARNSDRRGACAPLAERVARSPAAARRDDRRRARRGALGGSPSARDRRRSARSSDIASIGSAPRRGRRRARPRERCPNAQRIPDAVSLTAPSRACGRLSSKSRRPPREARRRRPGGSSRNRARRAEEDEPGAGSRSGARGETRREEAERRAHEAERKRQPTTRSAPRKPSGVSATGWPPSRRAEGERTAERHRARSARRTPAPAVAKARSPIRARNRRLREGARPSIERWIKQGKAREAAPITRKILQSERRPDPKLSEACTGPRSRPKKAAASHRRHAVSGCIAAVRRRRRRAIGFSRA
jgi:hypothetical protein